MGRQIRFYMFQEDEDEFLNFIETTGEIFLYPYRDKEKPFRPLKELPKYSWQGIWIYNKKIGTVKYYYIKEQKYYYLDRDKSSVIEFSRCIFNKKNNTLLGGRFWIATAYVEKDKSGELIWVEKPKEFLEWYEKIAKWVRKNYIKHETEYISKRVFEWIKKGGKLIA